jgi:hypothetical protein
MLSLDDTLLLQKKQVQVILQLYIYENRKDIILNINLKIILHTIT